MTISTSDECFKHFVDKAGFDGDGHPDLVGLFAYALVENERLEWISHRQETGHPIPSQIEVQDWFSAKPPSYFAEKLRQAETRFDAYARGYLADETQSKMQAAVRDAVGGLIEETKKGRWARAIIQGFLGNIAFAIFLVIITLVVLLDPSAIAVVKELFSRKA